MSAPWVVQDYELERHDSSRRWRVEQIGGKAHNLRQVRQQLPVPEFLVVTPATFHAALDAHAPTGCSSNLLARLADPRGEAAQAAMELRALITDMKWPDDLAAIIGAACEERFGNDQPVAVRSSAASEDSSRYSFAGMYESVLDVRGPNAVLEAIQQVWASFFSDRALAYRQSHGLAPNESGLAVIVQKMVYAEQSGVMFTCNPISGELGEIVIDIVPGSGEKLVQGEHDPETYRVRKDDPGLVSVLHTGESSGKYSPRASRANANQSSPQRVLTDSQLKRAAASGILLEKALASPQDVEFCFDGQGEFFVLQARPITTLAIAEPTAGNRMIWDNSNIIESYAGVTTPLTFSFIRRAYAIVYQCFAEVMGISPRTVHAHRSTFENMLGLFRGRVYYNLKNWYRLVRLFPGYQYNSAFMETMMGLKEPIVLDEERPKAGLLRRWFVDLPALVVLALRICWKLTRIESIVRKFEEHFDSHYERWRRIDFRAQQPQDLLGLYREMEDALLWNWKAPIINDFYVMVYYGMLKKLCVQWCDDRTGSLQNGLLCGTGNLASAEPSRKVLELARAAAGNEQLRELILKKPIDSLPRFVAGNPQLRPFQTLLNRYLDEYGLRCESELKLEELSHRDCPQQVYRMIRDYLLLDDVATLDNHLHQQREQRQREDAERTAFAALSRSSGWLPQRWIFRKVLNGARRGIRNRENMRFARTKIYGIARAMFRVIGERLVDEDVLSEVEDIFYLTTGEVWDYVQGTAVSTDLRGLAAIRRREYDAYRAGNPLPPDDRFETDGLPYLQNDFRRREAAAEADMNGGVLRGVACCPGIVEGTAQVVRQVADVDGFSGEILVAPRTDPGWAPLFPAFRGMLVQRGSALSHSAIVARELGIPTIVGISDLLEKVTTGSPRAYGRPQRNRRDSDHA